MKLLVVIPAFNEEKMIEYVLKDIYRNLRSKISYKIIVVNDGSTDRTELLAQKNNILVISHILNRGLGAAIATGFRYAKEHNFDVVVTIDADGQHKGKDISRILEPIYQNSADVVIGSRLIKANGMPLTRKIVNLVSNIITWLLFSIWTTDSQSGLRAFNSKAIQKIRIRSQKMEVSSEIFKEISRLKLKLAEVPISSIYTRYSLTKGQQLGNAPNVFWKLLMHKFS